MSVSSTVSEVVARVLAGLDADAVTPVLDTLDTGLPDKASEYCATLFDPGNITS